MIAALQSFANRLLGRGEAAIAVPTFDGALKANQVLEAAETLAELSEPADLASLGGALLIADGPRLLKLEGAETKEFRRFDRPITAFAALPEGRLAVALDGRDVQVYADPTAARPSASFASGLNAINALAPGRNGVILATDGSKSRSVEQWTWDLLEHGRSGRLLVLDPRDGSVKTFADNLGFAFGACASGEDVLVSESWKHRLIAVRGDRSKRIALPHLPVYPSRLSPASGGGFWLTGFAARSLLVEFVLREPAYRKRMMAEIAPEHWIAPRLSSGRSFKEPLQGAHIKTMGVIKPWAPPRSYGLVIRLNAAGAPLYSLHSRVDGLNHGIVTAIEHGGDLVMIAKGPGRILRLSLSALQTEFRA